MPSLNGAYLNTLSRAEIQRLAKSHNIKANLKTERLIQLLVVATAETESNNVARPATPPPRDVIDCESLQRSMAPSPVILPQSLRETLRQIQTPRPPPLDLTADASEDEADTTSASSSSPKSAKQEMGDPNVPPTPKHAAVKENVNTPATSALDTIATGETSPMPSAEASDEVRAHHSHRAHRSHRSHRRISPTNTVEDTSDYLDRIESLADVHPPSDDEHFEPPSRDLPAAWTAQATDIPPPTPIATQQPLETASSAGPPGSFTTTPPFSPPRAHACISPSSPYFDPDGTSASAFPFPPQPNPIHELKSHGLTLSSSGNSNLFRPGCLGLIKGLVKQERRGMKPSNSFKIIEENVRSTPYSDNGEQESQDDDPQILDGPSRKNKDKGKGREVARPTTPPAVEDNSDASTDSELEPRSVPPQSTTFYRQVMSALGHTPRSSPDPEEKKLWTAEQLREYYAFPSVPNYARFPDAENQEWEDLQFHSSNDIGFGDDGDIDRMTPSEREEKEYELERLVQDVNEIDEMYRDIREELRSLRPDVMHTRKEAMCMRRAGRQEKAMRERMQMFISHANLDVRDRWSDREMWHSQPVRQKKKDKIWREIPSDEERGSEDNISDNNHAHSTQHWVQASAYNRQPTASTSQLPASTSPQDYHPFPHTMIQRGLPDTPENRPSTDPVFMALSSSKRKRAGDDDDLSGMPLPDGSMVMDVFPGVVVPTPDPVTPEVRKRLKKKAKWEQKVDRLREKLQQSPDSPVASQPAPHTGLPTAEERGRKRERNHDDSGSESEGPSSVKRRRVGTPIPGDRRALSPSSEAMILGHPEAPAPAPPPTPVAVPPTPASAPRVWPPTNINGTPTMNLPTLPRQHKYTFAPPRPPVRPQAEPQILPRSTQAQKQPLQRLPSVHNLQSSPWTSTQNARNHAVIRPPPSAAPCSTESVPLDSESMDVGEAPSSPVLEPKTGSDEYADEASIEEILTSVDDLDSDTDTAVDEDEAGNNAGDGNILEGLDRPQAEVIDRPEVIDVDALPPAEVTPRVFLSVPRRRTVARNGKERADGRPNGFFFG